MLSRGKVVSATPFFNKTDTRKHSRSPQIGEEGVLINGFRFNEILFHFFLQPIKYPDHSKSVKATILKKIRPAGHQFFLVHFLHNGKSG